MRSPLGRLTAATTAAAVLTALIVAAPLGANAATGAPTPPPTAQTEPTVAPTPDPPTSPDPTPPTPTPTTAPTTAPTPTTAPEPAPSATPTATPTPSPSPTTEAAWSAPSPCTAGTPVLDVNITDENGLPFSDPAANKNAPRMTQVEGDKYHNVRATATISVADPTNAANNVAPTIKGEIKGRGNYTWMLGNRDWLGHLAAWGGTDYKRPYQIKFDKTTPVLGMKTAKTWVLLANATDGSLMRNKLALDYARSLGLQYTSDSRWVDLRVDGKCYGNYLMAEKVEVKKNRVDLSDKRGVVVEINNNMGDLTNPVEDYFYKIGSNVDKINIVLKDAKDGVPDLAEGPLPATTQAGWDDMKASMTQLYNALRAKNPDWGAISSLIDVDSFVKYYFVAELTENPEIVAASVYFYKNGPGDKIHAGPAWDYDSSLFNYVATENLGADPLSDYVKNAATLRKSGVAARSNPSSPVYQDLFRNPEFVDRANNLWKSDIAAKTAALPAQIDAYRQTLANSAALNFTLPRSRILGKPTLLVPGLGKNYESTWGGEVDYLKARVSQRINLLSREYGVVPTLTYRGFSQNIGWSGNVMSGQIAGTTGQSLRLEGFDLSVKNPWGQSGAIEASSHVQSIGWSAFGSTSSVGAPGKGLRLEALKLRLTGAMAATYDISYRAHVAEKGWQGWVTNGAQAGTTGQGLRIEAIQVRLLLKPGATPQPCLAAPPATLSYADIPKDYMFYDEVMSMANKGIMSGYDIGCGQREFRPHNAVSREDMAGFLYREAGSPAYSPPANSPFLDVPTNDPSYKEITWLASKGVTTGWTTPNGKEFRKNEQISREAMAAFLYRSSGNPSWTAPTSSPFVDVDPNTNIFYKEITWLANTGISKGWTTSKGQEFRPKENIARDAMAAFLSRYMVKFP